MASLSHLFMFISVFKRKHAVKDEFHGEFHSQAKIINILHVLKHLHGVGDEKAKLIGVVDYDWKTNYVY